MVTELPTRQPIANEHLAAIRPDMLRFARLQLRDAAAAEDAVQEALLAALANAQQFAGRAEAKTWVFGILRHKIVDIIRQQSRSTNVSSFSDGEESLDDTFESLFRENAHWTPASRPRDWGRPQGAPRPPQFLGAFGARLTPPPQ